MQPLAISQECLYFHKKFGCIYALTSYFCPVCIVRCISSCHILFHFLKKDIGEFFIRKELCGFKIRFILKISYPHP